MGCCLGHFNSVYSVPLLEYYDILQAAVRCKIAYTDKIDMHWLWKAARNGSLAPHLPQIDSSVLITQQLETLDHEPVYITSNDGKQDAQAYLWVTNGDTIYLTFRGTSSYMDMLTDADIKCHKLKDDIYVHEGFYLQFESVMQHITDLLNHYVNASTLIVAGHSLGGALAQIAAAYYGEQFPNLYVKCFTFGCPRMGNIGFVRWFEKNVSKNVRVTNKNDPVPMIPQRKVWVHTMNTCIAIDIANKVRIKKRDTPWFVRILTTLVSIDYLSPIRDHACEQYISRLNTLLQLQQNVTASIQRPSTPYHNVPRNSITPVRVMT